MKLLLLAAAAAVFAAGTEPPATPQEDLEAEINGLTAKIKTSAALLAEMTAHLGELTAAYNTEGKARELARDRNVLRDHTAGEIAHMDELLEAYGARQAALRIRSGTMLLVKASSGRLGAADIGQASSFFDVATFPIGNIQVRYAAETALLHEENAFEAASNRQVLAARTRFLGGAAVLFAAAALVLALQLFMRDGPTQKRLD